jgi:hypothetical protein
MGIRLNSCLWPCLAIVCWMRQPLIMSPFKRYGVDPMARPKDESFIIDLCDDVLRMKALRGHRFDFLLGDPGKDGRRRRLPVDAYYPKLNLVVEYNERQHSEPVGFFDRRIVASGITRGEQRKKYDLLRQELLPRHEIALVVFSYQEFEHGARKRLRRVPGDFGVIRARLSPFLIA